MVENNMDELVNRLSTIPFLFVGSGLTRRYFDLPDWDDLLKQMVSQINSDSLAYRSYQDRAHFKEQLFGLNPTVASLIEEDFNRMWFKDKSIRTVDEYNLKKVEQGCTPFKAEIAQYIKNHSQLKTTYKEEVSLLSKIAKKSVAGIITTNYDLFFEKYLSEYKVFVGQNELLFSQLQGISEIYKIHGSVSEPDTIIINERDYKNFKEQSEYLAAKLLTIFMEYPIIFIGYSISDKNIRDILSSIVKCMSEDKIERLKEKFVFVDYLETQTGYKIGETTFSFEDGKMMTMIKITLSDYSLLFKAIGKKKMKLPVRLLRMLKEELYAYTISNTPTKNLKVATLDDERVANDDLVLSIGTIDLEKMMGINGLKGISTAQWYRNIILDDLDFPNHTLLSIALVLSSQNSGILPVNSLVSSEQEKYDLNKLYIKDFNALISKTLKNEKVKHPELQSIDDVLNLKIDDLAKELQFMAYLEESEYSLEKLEKYLKNIFEKEIDILSSDKKGVKTNLRRLIRIYDYLKGKNK